MSDLIRRSDVIKALEECHLDKQLFEKDVFEKIKAIPTAYDVEKVVAELRTENSRYLYKSIPLSRCIDIVKAGGV